MPRIRSPRRSSLMYWHRGRANKPFARLRTWAPVKDKDAKLLGFAGYKVGMAHALITDNKASSPMKGTDIIMPFTVVECPPLRIIGIRSYSRDRYGLHVADEVLFSSDKDLKRTLLLPKIAKDPSKLKQEGMVDIRVLVATQPRLTTIGKKKPEVFELALSGSVSGKFAYAQAHFGKEISVQEVFSEGNQIDSHVITKGKGVQGPVKRHGVNIRRHKSEKTKRGPGSLAGWHGTLNWPVAHQGQMGYQQRSEFNKWIIKISGDTAYINPKSGWQRYGVVKNTYLLLKGSIGGPAKRLIKMTRPMRPDKIVPAVAPVITWTSVNKTSVK